MVVPADDQTLALSGTTLSVADGNSVDLSPLDTTKFVDGTNPADAVYTDGKVGIGTNNPTGILHTSANSTPIFNRVAGDTTATQRDIARFEREGVASVIIGGDGTTMGTISSAA